eukprot:803729-Heterocapsa_arctica.AAC.1
MPWSAGSVLAGVSAGAAGGGPGTSSGPVRAGWRTSSDRVSRMPLVSVAGFAMTLSRAAVLLLRR